MKSPVVSPGGLSDVFTMFGNPGLLNVVNPKVLYVVNKLCATVLAVVDLPPEFESFLGGSMLFWMLLLFVGSPGYKLLGILYSLLASSFVLPLSKALRASLRYFATKSLSVFLVPDFKTV